MINLAITVLLSPKGPRYEQRASSNSIQLAGVTTRSRRLDLSTLDDEVYYFAQSSIANSRKRTYRAGLNRYLSFCHEYNAIASF